MQSIFITGANRGIGLALARQYSQRENSRIFAACRNPQRAEALTALAQQYDGRIIIVPLEVTDDAAVTTAVETVRGQVAALDVFINNAAINPDEELQEFGRVPAGHMLDILHVNTVAPLILAQAFADLLQAGENPRLVNISSDMASLEWRTSGGDYGYCASKAALDMVTRGLAADLKRRHITAIALDPGWVRTAMGGPGATLAPEESARGVIAVIDGLSSADSGKFYRWDGGENPW